MKILFIHQNFPGQFKNLAPALSKRGHNVVALKMDKKKQGVQNINGVKVISYTCKKGSTPNIHPWVLDFETKIIRANYCFNAALELNAEGFIPDLVFAHHGWGESLFLKKIWPQSKLIIYCEFYYRNKGFDVDFDKEFAIHDVYRDCKLDLKNFNNLLHFPQADYAFSPTHWQKSSFPDDFKDKIKVIHDGINTNVASPDLQGNKFLLLNSKIRLTEKNEIITFVNRNLEPYRGIHIFMRCLPRLLKERPNAHVLIVGGDGVSYGAAPKDAKSWKDKFIAEVMPNIDVQDRERIYFLGNIPYHHFITMLQISTVHVYLTYPFVLSWSLMESMSVGCSIVASKTPPVEEVLTHGETGILCDFFDVEGVTNEVIRLLKDANLRNKLSHNARQFIIENYDLDKVCLPQQIEWLESIYESIN